MGSQQRGREAWWAVLKMMVTVMFVATAMLAMVTPSHAITAAGTSGLSPLATSWQTAYHYVRCVRRCRPLSPNIFFVRFVCLV
jgi:hypothetical protein